jgi:prevent-host-death family protein
MRTLPLSAVKARLSEIADEVDRTHDRVLVTKNGRDYVVLLAAEDLSSIEATLRLLTDLHAQDRLRTAEAELEADLALDRGDVTALVDGRGGRHRR